MLTLIHHLVQHLDTARCYARALFADFSSAFNTIQPHILIDKLRLLNVKPKLILWIADFLKTRTQRVKIGDVVSDQITTNTGTPQGCVLSPVLFILYTNDCTSDRNSSVHILKYADDTAVLGLIKNDESQYRKNVETFVQYCENNYLNLNVKKTKEIVFDFRVKRDSIPTDNALSIDNTAVEIVTSYKYLGTVIDNQLIWGEHVKGIATKCNQRLHFLQKLKSFHVDRTIMNLFYSSVIESVMTYDCFVWYNNARKKDISLLKRVVRQAGKILGKVIDLNTICEEKVLVKASKLAMDQNHPLNPFYVKLRSGKRWQSMRAKSNRYHHSFIPHSIRLLNKQ